MSEPSETIEDRELTATVVRREGDTHEEIRVTEAGETRATEENDVREVE